MILLRQLQITLLLNFYGDSSDQPIPLKIIYIDDLIIYMSLIECTLFELFL